MSTLAITPAPPTTRPLSSIANDIYRTWDHVYFGAMPYLQAMRSLGYMDDTYGQEGADEIVQRFLSNARTWRGSDARRIKAELNALTSLAEKK